MIYPYITTVDWHRVVFFPVDKYAR